MGQGRNLKRIMQLLFSISFVTFLISISSWLCYGFQTVKFCVTTLPVQLITHSINRNCIFLLCNGLLVFIAKSSGLISSTTSVSSQHSCPSFNDEDQNPRTVENREVEKQQHVVVEKGIASPTVDKEVVMVQRDGSPFKRWLFEKVTLMEKGENQDEDIKELSMDEVNKRFDEFIWKMKAEMRVEAPYRQLVNYV